MGMYDKQTEEGHTVSNKIKQRQILNSEPKIFIFITKKDFNG